MKTKRNSRGGSGRTTDRKEGAHLFITASFMAAAVILAAAIGTAAVVHWRQSGAGESPDRLLSRYMACVADQEYGQMYEMLDQETAKQVGREDFIKRNSAIYEGIGMRDMTIEITAYDKEQKIVAYKTSFDTNAGNISFENEAFFQKGEEGYGLVWEDSLIFPGLCSKDKVRVSTAKAKRGRILDRNGRVLAGEGAASSVGIVPGKLERPREAIEEMAALLEIGPEAIEKKLSAGWVKEDSFVPVRTIPKIKETDIRAVHPSEEILEERERQEKLLAIPGIMLTDLEVREYPLGEAAAHLVGYVQEVTAEDLKEHAGEGYGAGSVIGRSGMESLFEKELRGKDGCRIYIEDEKGREKEELAFCPARQGEDVRLTVEADLQTVLYEQFREDKSCSVAMDPYTGEVLALVSTPSYDNNDFLRGLSDEQWRRLNEDERKPMLSRFRQVWCPGSVFKPVIAAVGLELGAIDPGEDYGKEGLRWQKDDSWGSYYVTTLHECEPADLENALIYSDNIFFAKAALRIGGEALGDFLAELGFAKEIPFAVRMQESRYSNGEGIGTEIQLADSGYGQGQILINPLHLACLYSAFCNRGNVVGPSLVYRQGERGAYWIPEAFSEKTAERVSEALKKVVNDPRGTGYGARREDILLAGKTGTAEIKDSKEDTSGTELGWFAVFTAEKTAERPILLVSIAEDVKDRGGSGYVVEKDRKVLEAWFGGGE